MAREYDTVVRVFKEFDKENCGVMKCNSLRKVMMMIGLTEEEADKLLANFAQTKGGEQTMVKYEAFLERVFVNAPEKDVLTYYAKPRGDIPKVARVLNDEEAKPVYASLDEFREKHASDSSLLEQLRNRVRVCPNPSCKKPNGYTMKSCNACETSLEGVQEGVSDNIFMGFIYGIAKGKFLYKVSTRRESPEMLAFDDPLGVGVVHLCVIPTNVFCPDLRFLFRDPAKGLKLVDDLMEFGRQAVLEHYWSNAEFRSKYWCGEKPPETLEDMIELAGLGFNFPPSMFQLHLQFIHGPWFPFHEVMLRKGVHLQRDRFFPFEYVRAALALGDQARMDVDADTKIEDIVERIASLGVDYHTMHDSMLKKCERFSQRFDVWRPEDFEYKVTDGKVFSLRSGEHLETEQPKDIQNEDNLRMKNYDKNKCSYYKYIKSPGEVQMFPSSL